MGELVLTTPFTPWDWERGKILYRSSDQLFCSHAGGVSHLDNLVSFTALKTTYWAPKSKFIPVSEEKD